MKDGKPGKDIELEDGDMVVADKVQGGAEG